MLPTNMALHPQPLPTTTRRTSDAGRPPARKSDGAKCPERRHLRSIVRPGSAPTRTAHRHPRRRVTSSPSQHCLAVSRLTALLLCAGDRDTSAGSCRAVWHASMPTRLVGQSGMLRATVDLDADATIVALDGRNACTTPVHRRASCARRGRPGPRLSAEGTASSPLTTGGMLREPDGGSTIIHQGEGCEQGDAFPGTVCARPTRCPCRGRRALATR